jgi:hypothetical protein
MMAVEIRGGSNFEHGAPKPLFDTRLSSLPIDLSRYDVSKDGRFLIPLQIEAANVPVTVVVNWAAGLKK